MTEEQPGPSDAAPGCGTLAALGGCAFVAGLPLGAVQPLFVVGLGPGIVAGPSYVGLVFLLCLGLTLVTGALALVGGRWITVPAFVTCGSLALGLLVGNLAASAFEVGYAAYQSSAAAPASGLLL